MIIDSNDPWWSWWSLIILQWCNKNSNHKTSYKSWLRQSYSSNPPTIPSPLAQVGVISNFHRQWQQNCWAPRAEIPQLLAECRHRSRGAAVRCFQQRGAAVNFVYRCQEGPTKDEHIWDFTETWQLERGCSRMLSDGLKQASQNWIEIRGRCNGIVVWNLLESVGIFGEQWIECWNLLSWSLDVTGLQFSVEAKRLEEVLDEASQTFVPRTWWNPGGQSSKPGRAEIKERLIQSAWSRPHMKDTFG